MPSVFRSVAWTRVTNDGPYHTSVQTDLGTFTVQAVIPSDVPTPLFS